MIDTDNKYERTTPELEEFEGENLGDLLTNLLAEVKKLQNKLDRLQEEYDGALNDIENYERELGLIE